MTNARRTIRESLTLLPPNTLVPLSWLRALAEDAGLLSDGPPIPGDLDVDEVASLIHRSPPTVRRLARDGSLRGYKHNGREWRFPQSAVMAYIEGQRATPYGADR